MENIRVSLRQLVEKICLRRLSALPNDSLEIESELRLRIAFELKETILQYSAFPVAKIVLFGSVAKGKANKDSDVDICLIYPNNLGYDTINPSLKEYELVHEIDYEPQEKNFKKYI